MKRILLGVLIAFLLISSFFTSPSQKAFAASISDNSVIILSGNVNEQNKLVIKANLVLNTGINGMTLELSYDKNAMVLSNVEFGTALSSLDPITTNTKTPQGYAITPFVFNYWGEENDFSKGNLFTLTFDLLDDVNDGDYLISLNYTKNKDVIYFDESYGSKTKNLYVDNTEIQIRNNSVADIISIKDNEQTSKIWIIICVLIASAAVIISGILVALKFIKKRRNWKRL